MEKQSDQDQEYIKKNINPIFEELAFTLIKNQPNYQEIVDQMITWLQQNRSRLQEQVNKNNNNNQQQQQQQQLNLQSQNSFDSQEEDDVMASPKKEFLKEKKQRSSVSAEVYGNFNKKEDFQPKIIVKSPEQYQKIKDRLMQSFLFNTLDQKELDIVINAMEVVNFDLGSVIIKQGEEGNHMYVIEEGELDCYKTIQGEEKLVKQYENGGAFGELALLYNCPRAATIISQSDVVLFKLDRDTFNKIVKDSAIHKRERYEEFLKQIEIFNEMDPYEKSQLAECLKTVEYKKGDFGEQGDKFYIIEEGEAIALKSEPNQQEQIVYNYKPGDYFGELALIRNKPRAASILAQTDLKLATMDKNSFQRLLGPLEEILKRNFKRYEKFVQ